MFWATPRCSTTPNSRISPSPAIQGVSISKNGIHCNSSWTYFPPYRLLRCCRQDQHLKVSPKSPLRYPMLPRHRLRPHFANSLNFHSLCRSTQNLPCQLHQPPPRQHQPQQQVLPYPPFPTSLSDSDTRARHDRHGFDEHLPSRTPSHPASVIGQSPMNALPPAASALPAGKLPASRWKAAPEICESLGWYSCEPPCSSVMEPDNF